VVPYPGRTFIVYVDDSGNEDVGWLWTAIAHPIELWTDHLGRWLNFRRWLYNQHGVPADFELHAQVWLSRNPSKDTPPDQLALVSPTGDLLPVMRRDRESRKSRFQIYEKALKTIGSLPEAKLFTTHSCSSTGNAKLALYDDLLCFLEQFLASEPGHAKVIVDGLHDSGGHLRAAHRALLIAQRRITEDASHRSSADSQLLQMADLCAYAALQSIQQKASVDPRFHAQYQITLSRLIVKPDDVPAGRCIRGLDYRGDHSDFPSRRAITADTAP
jgi:hypothetical protein